LGLRSTIQRLLMPPAHLPAVRALDHEASSTAIVRRPSAADAPLSAARG
jgi:hypothetical protein